MLCKFDSDGKSSTLLSLIWHKTLRQTWKSRVMFISVLWINHCAITWSVISITKVLSKPVFCVMSVLCQLVFIVRSLDSGVMSTWLVCYVNLTLLLCQLDSVAMSLDYVAMSTCICFYVTWLIFVFSVLLDSAAMSTWHCCFVTWLCCYVTWLRCYVIWLYCHVTWLSYCCYLSVPLMLTWILKIAVFENGRCLSKC